MSLVTENGQKEDSSFESTSPHKVHWCSGNRRGTGNSWEQSTEVERGKKTHLQWGEDSNRAGLTSPEREKVSRRGPSPAPDAGAKYIETPERWKKWVLNACQLCLQRDRRVWCLLIGWRSSALLLGWKWDALRDFYFSLWHSLSFSAGNASGLQGTGREWASFLSLVLWAELQLIQTPQGWGNLGRVTGVWWRQKPVRELSIFSWITGAEETDCWATKAGLKRNPKNQKNHCKDLTWGKCWDRKRSYKTYKELMHPAFCHVMF